MTSSTGGTGDIQAVHRVAQILRLFTVNQPQITVAEAATQLGLNRTTVHRYFGSLLLDNVLERSRDEPTAFVPGRLLLQLGAVAQGQRRVLDLAPSHLRRLSLETELTVVLSVWGESGPVVSLVAETGTHPILITVRIGTTLDHDSAQTLFASFLKDRDVVASFLAKIPREPRQKFKDGLAGCRRTGICRNEMAPTDSVVVAVPVFDEHDIAATIALIGTTSSLPADDSEKVAALRRTAYRITEELGGTDLWRSAIEDHSLAFLEPATTSH